MVTCPPGSLYCMSRKSQEVFEHTIEPGSISSGIRYSLTFRCLDWKNRNSTCLMGNSNTGGLKFGSDKRGMFGELMPGKKFWAPTIDDIDPTSCLGYSNAVILCGINDIKHSEVTSESDVIGFYQKLKMKVQQIKSLSPQTHIYICRLLPTKDNVLNQKVITFNRAIYSDMLKTCKGVACVDGFVK